MSNEGSDIEMTPSFGGSLPGVTAAMPETPPATISNQAAMMPGSIMKIPVAIQVVIGSARLPLSQVAMLGPGAMITLDQKLGTAAAILVNGKEVARGELFVLDGEGGQLGITITEVTGGGNAAD